MPDSAPSRPASDRNLLFGILALQMDFIGRDALIAAMNAWVLEKEKPLGRVLLDRGALAEDEHDLLEAMVARSAEVPGDRVTVIGDSGDGIGTVGVKPASQGGSS